MKVKTLLVFCCILIACRSGNVNWTNRIEELKELNKNKITVTCGVYGTITLTEGNCMPTTDAVTTCKTKPARRFIFIYNYAYASNTPSSSPGYYTAVNAKYITTVESDDDGFYQAELPPGNYSVFVMEDDKYYASVTDGKGRINPLVVFGDKVELLDIDIDKAVH